MPDLRFEDTEITIKLRPSGLYKAPQTGKVVFKLTKENGDAASEAVLAADKKEQTVTIPAKRYLGTDDEQIELKITAPKVPEKEEFYTIRYEVDFPTWPGGAREHDGHTEYEIWPAEYVVETVRTGDAAAAPGKSEGDKFERVAIEDGHSNADGKYTFVPTAPGAVADFTIKEPYLLVEWVVDEAGGFTRKCRKRKAKVDSKPWVAKILSHPDQALGRTLDKAVVQWVNLDPLDGADKGSLVKVEVGPVDINMIGDRRKVHVKVTFPTDISKRNDPFPAVWKTASKSSALTPVNAAGKPGVDELVYDMTDAQALEIAAGKDRVEFYVQLGLAGGVYCKIEVGTVATALTDDTLFLEAWRRLQFETWQPKSDGDATTKLSSWTLGGVAGTPGIAPAATAHIYQTFAGTATGTRADRDKACFIDWRQREAGLYTKDTLAAQPWIPVSGGTTLIPSWDAAFFDEAAGNKITVLTDDQVDELARALNPAPDKTLNQIVFADFIAYAEAWSQSFNNISSPRDLTPSKGLLPWNIASGAVDSGSITEIHWIASVNDGSGWVEDPDGMGWTALTDAAAINAHAKIVKTRKIRLSLPNDPSRADYPGTYKASMPSTHQVRFKIFFRGHAWSWEGVNGSALMGIIGMNRYTSAVVHPIGVANVIIHEIGHNMGQAYGDQTIDPTFGRSNANMIPGIDNPVSVASGGNLYGGHGHQGTHCAFGLSATDKACADYGSKSGSCVMFGSDDMTRSNKAKWCPDCKSYIKGTELDDVRKHWPS